jgi:hypothetical protein
MTGTITIPPPMPIRPASNPTPAPDSNPRQTSQGSLIGTPMRVGHNKGLILRPRGAAARTVGGSEGQPWSDVKPLEARDPGKLPGRGHADGRTASTAKKRFSDPASTCTTLGTEVVNGWNCTTVIPLSSALSKPLHGQSRHSMLDGSGAVVLRSLFKDLKTWSRGGFRGAVVLESDG